MHQKRKDLLNEEGEKKKGQRTNLKQNYSLPFLNLGYGR
uniref:Uncharacterized protein n=1 Tax=Rhizophora mucronata TaxID=61149 RepID=A0A2P2N765_RHIMU